MALLYELLAGRTPFAGPGTDYTVAHRHVVSLPPALPLPDPLVAQLDALLDKNPATRPTAGEAAAALRRLAPTLADLPALTPQAPPDDFDTARGPVTMVRGMVPDVAPVPAVAVDPDEPDPPHDLDLGTPDQGTLLRPMTTPRPSGRRRRPPVSASRTRREATRLARPPGPRPRRSLRGRCSVEPSPTRRPPASPPRGRAHHPSTPTVVETDNSDPTTPTGLTVTRDASYDPETDTLELSLTYGAQSAPLGGPFLEVIPGDRRLRLSDDHLGRGRAPPEPAVDHRVARRLRLGHRPRAGAGAGQRDGHRRR